MIRADMQPGMPGLYRMKAAWVTRCPHLILAPEHYRPNGSCRCNDPSHPMGEWGYQCDDREHRWLAAEEAEQRRRRRTRSWRDWFRRR